MSGYAAVDAVISTWVKTHNLRLFTEYKDSEVRSVDVLGENGRRFQIWIDSPQGRSVAVHVWNYKKMRKDWDVGVADLAQCLDAALDTAVAWGREK